MCPDGTQCRQGYPDAPDTTRCSAWIQDAQDAQDAESRIGESGRNTTVSDAGYLFAHVLVVSDPSLPNVIHLDHYHSHHYRSYYHIQIQIH